MSPFSGFNTPTTKTTPIPAAFFSELLPEIKDIDELRVVLWVFRCLDMQEGDLRYLTLEDFTNDGEFMVSFGKIEKEQEVKLGKALEGAIRRGVLLMAKEGEEVLYFLNSPRGRAALESLTQGAWQPNKQKHSQLNFSANRPNIFATYEQNIGPLTPLLADELREAEKQYPLEWVTDAIKIAINNNVRNWHYIEAILRSWKEKGRDERDQRSSKENRRLDGKGEFDDYILH